jgi:FKBP-type peptidyl-prolyl cis-trans isomerase FkpA
MMLTRNVLLAGLLTFFLYACKKTETEQTGCVTNYGNPSVAEVTNLRNYIISNGITADEDTKGFFYHITFAGLGSGTLAVTDSVTIKYKGALTSGTIFDSTATGVTAKYLLSDLITGWRVGLPLIKKGGIIDLYLPPSHGYGCEGYGPVPANANTMFHIELIDF